MKVVFQNIYLVYAVKSLQRNARRSLVLLFTISTTFALSVIASRYADGVLQLWKDGAIDTGTGHFQLHDRRFIAKPEGLDPDSFIKDGNPMEDQLAHDKDVESWVKRLRFEGLITSDLGSTYFFATATQPQKELQVSPRMFNPPYDSGVFVSTNIPASAAIGEGLAKILHVGIGDEATLIAQTANGSINAIDVVISGIVDVPLPSFSKHSIYINLELAQKLLRASNTYNEVAVRLKSGTDLSRALRRYHYRLWTKNIVPSAWWDIEPLISRIESIWLTIAGILSGLLVLSASLTAINIIFMSVNERLTEIGTLMAVGVKPLDVVALLAAEGAVVGLMGGIIGCIFSCIVVGLMGHFGVVFESPFGSGTEIAHPTIDFLQLAIGVVLAIVLCSICSIPPAIRASKLDPVISLRGLT